MDVGRLAGGHQGLVQLPADRIYNNIDRPTKHYSYHRRRINTEEKAKVVTAIWGMESFNSMPRWLFCTRMILKKRMNRIMATWRNDCFGKMDEDPVDIIPN